MDVLDEMRCKQRIKDWNDLMQAIEKENTQPSQEGWIRDECLWDPPIPHDGIDMVPDLAPWTWMEPKPSSDEQPIVIFDESEPVFKKPGQLVPVPVVSEPVFKKPGQLVPVVSEPVFKKPGQLVPVPVVPVPVLKKPKPEWPAARRVEPKTEANLKYMEWARQTSMTKDMYECLCKWCTSYKPMKGHRCHLCSFVYLDDVALFIAHVKQVHGSVWPRRCSWSGCVVDAQDEKELLRHVQYMHMGADPFTCKGCGANCRTVYFAQNHCPD